MKKKISYIFIFTLLFLIPMFIFAGCNQENKQIEEKIEGIWRAERRFIASEDSEVSYLLLSDNREIYLSTDITRVRFSGKYFYEGDVYKGYYSIIKQKYLVLNLTQVEYGVEIESENMLEFFNSSLSNFKNNFNKDSTKTLIYEIQDDGEILKSVEDNPYQYLKIGE